MQNLCRSMLEADLAAREFTLALSGPYDAGSALLSIHAGAGGTHRIHAEPRGLFCLRRICRRNIAGRSLPRRRRTATVATWHRQSMAAEECVLIRAAACMLDERRLHLQDGPIDLIVEARGTPSSIEAAYAAGPIAGLTPTLAKYPSRLASAPESAWSRRFRYCTRSGSARSAADLS